MEENKIFIINAARDKIIFLHTSKVKDSGIVNNWIDQEGE